MTDEDRIHRKEGVGGEGWGWEMEIQMVCYPPIDPRCLEMCQKRRIKHGRINKLNRLDCLRDPAQNILFRIAETDASARRPARKQKAKQ